MKIILINPAIYQNTARHLRPIVKNLFYNSAPLGLCYLAAVLRSNAHQVKIIDAAAQGLSLEQTLQRILDFAPEVAGITTFTVSADPAYQLARAIKQRLTQVKVVVGGPHISANPQDLQTHPEIDLAILGEGETGFVELLTALKEKSDLSAVAGLAFSSQGKIHFTAPRGLILNLDSLPFPARDLLPLELYKPQPNDQRGLPKLSMISSRGCPYSCIFCDKNVFGNTYRSFSPAYIVSEMRHLVKEFKAKDIAFVDSTFTPNQNRVYELIKQIRQANLPVSWTCSVRADILDKPLLQEMKQAGCWRVRIGIESGNEQILKFIKKGITKHQAQQVATWAYELDLEPKGFFMLGHLPDTQETIQQTISFALSLPLKDITVQLNTPLKNTPQYPLIEKFGHLVTDNYSDYSFFEPVFLPNSLSYQELYSLYRKFYLKFYLRPVIWYKHIKKIRSFCDIIKYFRGLTILAFMLIYGRKKDHN